MNGASVDWTFRKYYDVLSFVWDLSAFWNHNRWKSPSRNADSMNPIQLIYDEQRISWSDICIRPEIS